MTSCFCTGRHLVLNQELKKKGARCIERCLLNCSDFHCKSTESKTNFGVAFSRWIVMIDWWKAWQYLYSFFLSIFFLNFNHEVEISSQFQVLLELVYFGLCRPSEQCENFFVWLAFPSNLLFFFEGCWSENMALQPCEDFLQFAIFFACFSWFFFACFSWFS